MLRMGEIEGVKQKSSSKKIKRMGTKEIKTENMSKPEAVIERICKDILGKLRAKFDIEAV